LGELALALVDAFDRADDAALGAQRRAQNRARLATGLLIGLGIEPPVAPHIRDHQRFARLHGGPRDALVGRHAQLAQPIPHRLALRADVREVQLTPGFVQQDHRAALSPQQLLRLVDDEGQEVVEIDEPV